MMSPTTIVTKAAVPGSSPGQNPLDILTRQHNLIFAVYIVLLVLVIIFTYLVWRSGNRVQDATRADANAHIEEAKRGAATANERAKKLENDNLNLQGTIAILQKDAANAKIEQQKVETDLQKQKEKTASAETMLFRLQRQHAPRMLDLAGFVEFLKSKPLAAAEVLYKKDDGDAFSLAWQIVAGLSSSGWKVSRPNPIPDDLKSQRLFSEAPEVLRDAPLSVRLGVQPAGVTIIAKRPPAHPLSATESPLEALAQALSMSLGESHASFEPTYPDNFFRIIVLQKP